MLAGMANPTLDFPTLQLTLEELNNLPTYNCSLPTGTPIGKRWKRNFVDRSSATFNVVIFGLEFRFPWWPDAWAIGEYVPCDIPGQVGIRWSVVELKVPKAAGML